MFYKPRFLIGIWAFSMLERNFVERARGGNYEGVTSSCDGNGSTECRPTLRALEILDLKIPIRDFAA